MLSFGSSRFHFACRQGRRHRSQFERLVRRQGTNTSKTNTGLAYSSRLRARKILLGRYLGWLRSQERIGKCRHSIQQRMTMVIIGRSPDDGGHSPRPVAACSCLRPFGSTPNVPSASSARHPLRAPWLLRRSGISCPVGVHPRRCCLRSGHQGNGRHAVGPDRRAPGQRPAGRDRCFGKAPAIRLRGEWVPKKLISHAPQKPGGHSAHDTMIAFVGVTAAVLLSVGAGGAG